MKSIKKVLIISLCAVMLFSLSACGGSGGDSAPANTEAPASDASTGDAPDGDATTASTGPYRLGYTYFGPDWALDKFNAEILKATVRHNPDNTLDSPSGEFQADKMQSAVQTLIASKVDGINYYAIFSTLLPTVLEMTSKANMPMVLSHSLPEEDQYELLLQYDNFIGFFGADNYKCGFAMGEQAAKDGGTKAIIASGAPGTVEMELKKSGFKDGFATGGGEVVDIITTNYPTEVQAKVSDSLTAHPEADTGYGTVGAHTIGLTSAMAAHDRELLVYCSDVDVDITKDIRDGIIMAGDTGASVDGVIAQCLLLNYLDGHPILDPDGKAPIFNWVAPIVITQENAQDVLDYVVENPVFTDKMIDKYLWNKNPDVTYEDFKDVADNYSLEWLMAFRAEVGEGE